MSEGSSIEFKINEPAPIVYETQIEGMRQLVSAERFKPIEEFVRAHCRVVDDSERIKDVHEAWARINEQLRNAYLERLGSLAVEQGFRMAPDQEVPGVRGLGYSPSAVYFDEPFDQTAAYDEWSGRTSSSARMEYGMLRGRNAWISIPGVTQSGPTCLSAAVIEGHPRIEVKV